MFFGAGDVYVNLRYKTSKMLGDEWSPNQPLMNFGGLMKMEWVLEVRALDIEVEVTAQAAPQAPQEIITSCLLAGVKQVAEEWIYDGACAKIETQFGFAVDRWISPEIASVTASIFTSEGCSYEVYLDPVIFWELVKEPKITAYYQGDKDTVDLEMVIECYGKTMKSRIPFAAELFHEQYAECINTAKYKFMQSLYDEMPELSHLWTQIRYNWFDMGNMSPEAISWMNKIHGKNTKWQSHKNPWKPAITPSESGEDRRVKELPGLNEMVKHPVSQKTGQLKSVIISLNDTHKWTREAIADWLDTLDIDISFKASENEQD